MDNPKPRRRFLKIFLALVAVVAVSAIGGSLYYMLAANGAGEAQETASGTENGQPAEENAAEGEGGEGTENGEEDGEEKDEKDAIPVSVIAVSRGTVSSYVTATANLVAENDVKVLAEAEGRVDRLMVEEGDYVKKGQLLAALVQDDERIAYQKALVRSANAETTFQRSTRMGEQQMISEEDLEKVAMDHDIAEQEMAEAKWSLDKTEIRAPFGGRVTERMITVGQHIRPGDELFTVTDFDPLIARIYLPEKDVIGLQEGREVRIALKADESVKFRGRIRQISPVVDIATGTVKLTIEAVNPPGDVRPGGFVNVDVVRETRPDVVLLPREAVIRELQKAHVFVVDGEVAERRAVSLGLEEGDSMEIVSGVDAGEEVVIAGQGSLKDGSAIKIIPASTDATALSDSDKDKRPGRPARG